MTLSGFFFLCLLAGLIYAVISLLMSGGLSADLGGDADGVDADGGSGEITFSPVSPTVIATFITAFGAGGIVATEGLKWAALPAVLLACGSGLCIGGIVYFALSAVYSRTQGSSEARSADAIGELAEVLSPISADSHGEIAYVSRGTRLTGSARSIDGEPIERHTLVEIVKIVGSTHYVKPATDASREDLPQEEK
jgi:membrane protein implicated in regulation of membrane protease activity